MTSVSSNWNLLKAKSALGGHFTSSSVKLNNITISIITITIITIIIIIIFAPGLVASAIGKECWSSIAAVVQGTVALFDDYHDDDDDSDDSDDDGVDDDDDGDGDDNLAGEERVWEITKLKVVLVAAFNKSS